MGYNVMKRKEDKNTGKKGDKKMSRQNTKEKVEEIEMVLSTTEVADVLGVLPSQVRSLCRQGRIEYKHHETNYQIQIKKSDLDKYIKKGARSAGRGRARNIDQN